MQLHEYQLEAKQFLLQKMFSKNGGGGLWLDCGLGKTAVSLHAIKDLIDLHEISQAIVVAPSRVIATAWPQEIEDWGLDLSWTIVGGPTTEKRIESLKAKSDILFIPSESLSYRVIKTKVKQLAEILDKQGPRPECLLVDEITKFKNWSASRSKSLRKFLVKDSLTRGTLTGTPAPNSLGDVFPQHFAVDQGETLGTAITRFRSMYMQQCGFENRQWEMRPDRVQDLKDALAPWYLHQSALDHLDLPPLLENEIDVHLPKKHLATYKKFEEQMLVEINGQEVGTLSSSGRYNLCRQIASGNAYTLEQEPVAVHSAKLEAVEGLLDELNGKPLMLAYWYSHEHEALLKRFPFAKAIRGGTTGEQTKRIVDEWQTGSIPLLICQSAAVSHGVNGLQRGGGDLCWFTLPDQPEVFHQTGKRLYRQGSTSEQVRIHYLLAIGTIDRVILRSLRKKDATERSLLEDMKKCN